MLKCQYTECRYPECHYTECRYAECRYAACRYAKCHGALVRWVWKMSASETKSVRDSEKVCVREREI